MQRWLPRQALAPRPACRSSSYLALATSLPLRAVPLLSLLCCIAPIYIPSKHLRAELNSRVVVG